MEKVYLSNCYNLYKEKFGESIQQKLEETISASKNSVGNNVEIFLNKFIVEPSKLTREQRNSPQLEKEILDELIKSKNWLINSIDSPYLFFYEKYSQSETEMAKKITWYWLSFHELPYIGENQFSILEETLSSIGYHLAIYKLNDQLREISEGQGETTGWPSGQNLETYHFNNIKQAVDDQKELLKQIEIINQKHIKRLNKERDDLNDKLYLKKDEASLYKDEASLYKTKLDMLQTQFFFHEDELFDDYVFGDILPELKKVYNLLKEYKVFDSNWGYFCHCLTVKNYSSTKPLKLKLSLKGSKFDTKDLGYILNLLQNEFFIFSKTDYLQWLTKVIEIESSRENLQDIENFYRKHIRPYQKGKTGPAFYDQITEKLYFFVVRSA